MMVDSPTYTTNKNFIKPNSGGYVDTWAAPVNTDYDNIDKAFAGVTAITWTNSGGITPAVAKSLTQTDCVSAQLYIANTQTLLNNTIINLPTGINGTWVVNNQAVGGYQITFQVPTTPGGTTAAGNTVICGQDVSSIIYSDGTNIDFADSRVTGGAVGGGSDQIFYLNGTTVNSSYTIPTGDNAMSAGPITVEATATVTISSGSTWTIV